MKAANTTATYSIRWGALLQVQLGLELVGLANYILVLLVILFSRDKCFTNPFYSFFTVGAINDITVATATVFLRISKEMGLCDNLEYVYRFCGFLTGTCFFNHYIVNCWIIYFRLRATSLFTVDKITLKRYKRLLYMGLATSFVMYIFTFSISFSYQISDGFCHRIPRSEKDLGIYRTFSAVETLFFMFFLLIGIPAIVRNVYKHKKKSNSKQYNICHYLNMCLFSVLQFFGFFVEFVYEILRLFNLEHSNPITVFVSENFLTYYFVLMVISGVFVIIAQKDLRSKLFPFSKKTNAVSPTVSGSLLNQMYSSRIRVIPAF